MTSRLPIFSLALSLLLAPAAATAAQDDASASSATAETTAESQVFATVDGKTIGASEYESTLLRAARQKFYHGTPPESQITALRREVGIDIIDRILLTAAAKERGLGPDKEAVDAKIAGYEARYKNSAQWKEQRESVLPGLRKRLEEDSVLEVLEEHVRDLPPPSEAKVREYYAANPEKFTEPEKIKLGVILLSVDPSSPSEIWKMARDEATRIHEKLLAGEDFAKLAALHSSDASADNDGEMEYIHRGMTPAVLQDTIDEMEIGAVSEPLRILEGVGIFKLLGRKAPVKHTFERVQERATDLYNRDRKELAWKDFKRGLRAKAKLTINSERYPAFAQFDPVEAQPSEVAK